MANVFVSLAQMYDEARKATREPVAVSVTVPIQNADDGSDPENVLLLMADPELGKVLDLFGFTDPRLPTDHNPRKQYLNKLAKAHVLLDSSTTFGRVGHRERLKQIEAMLQEVYNEALEDAIKEQQN
jgi:hypothetical protein